MKKEGKKMNWVEEAFEEIKEDVERFWEMNYTEQKTCLPD
jgi:hypothetical protein